MIIVCFYGTEAGITIRLLLRRTLVRFVILFSRTIRRSFVATSLPQLLLPNVSKSNSFQHQPKITSLFSETATYHVMLTEGNAAGLYATAPSSFLPSSASSYPYERVMPAILHRCTNWASAHCATQNEPLSATLLHRSKQLRYCLQSGPVQEQNFGHHRQW